MKKKKWPLNPTYTLITAESIGSAFRFELDRFSATFTAQPVINYSKMYLLLFGFHFTAIHSFIPLLSININATLFPRFSLRGWRWFIGRRTDRERDSVKVRMDIPFAVVICSFLLLLTLVQKDRNHYNKSPSRIKSRVLRSTIPVQARQAIVRLAASQQKQSMWSGCRALWAKCASWHISSATYVYNALFGTRSKHTYRVRSAFVWGVVLFAIPTFHKLPFASVQWKGDAGGCVVSAGLSLIIIRHPQRTATYSSAELKMTHGTMKEPSTVRAIST